ncbi:MAG: sulfotransferase [Desulfuromusa sp.]|nr:sulfotransferase [Desulfuromusa sp.]
MIDNLFLSVGAMKAGTTWLYLQLSEHPEIYFTPEKEIHYFANKVGIENQLNQKNRIQKLKDCLNEFSKGNLKYIHQNIETIAWYVDYARPKEITNEWYIDLFKRKGNEKYCADFSNLYCQMQDDGWENVYSAAKNVKIVYTLRDPIERLWSHYKFHMKWSGQEADTLRLSIGEFEKIIDSHWLWINTEYVKNHQNLTKNVPDSDLLIVYFEDFREAPRKSLFALQDFLGLKKKFCREDFFDKKINKSNDLTAPSDWLDSMHRKLHYSCSEMKDIGIWHPAWHEV